MKFRKSYCTNPGGGGGGGVSKKFNVKVFYVMGKVLSGVLSCPCDKSCFFIYFAKKLIEISNWKEKYYAK